jgi:hypothetical protein
MLQERAFTLSDYAVQLLNVSKGAPIGLSLYCSLTSVGCRVPGDSPCLDCWASIDAHVFAVTSVGGPKRRANGMRTIVLGRHATSFG